MNEEQKESDIVRLLEWALMTIRDKLQFGLPEEIAIQRRELRVKGVLIDVLGQVKELEEKYDILIAALIEERGHSGSPESMGRVNTVLKKVGA